MAYFLFIDESGTGQESPYEVLAGIAIEDRDLWNLVLALQEAELRCFGIRYKNGNHELKARKLLKTKTFRQTINAPTLRDEETRELAKKCLESGATASKQEITGLAKAKLRYVQEALEICGRYRCKAFASIVNRNSPRPKGGLLRKDYAYLFERFFYFLEEKDSSSLGVIVFDELEKSQSHILLDQMDGYFKHTLKGRQRASQIIPEPFFVHSDLTTGIQLADLAAYIIAWGVRFEGMTESARPELKEYAEQVVRLRTRAIREVAGNPNYTIWSFAIITDLRSREEQMRQ
jgi:hypothetical protein